MTARPDFQTKAVTALNSETALLDTHQMRQADSLAVACGVPATGFVAARQLARQGWPVRIALLGAGDHLSGKAAHHIVLWEAAVEAVGPAALGDRELVIDVLFGAELTRALHGALTMLATERPTVASLPEAGAVTCHRGRVIGTERQ